MTPIPVDRRRTRQRASWTVRGVAAATMVLAACSSDDGSGTRATPAPAVSDDASTTDATGPGATENTLAEPTAPDEQDEHDEPGIEPEGFTTITAIVTDTAGEECEVCLWLADSADERARGLMGVTDLGDASGMAFVFSEPTAGAFYMFRTPTPLSIAWFDATGSWVGTADMEPCLDTTSDDCARYAPDDAYTVAVEVFEGDLPELGIGAGSSIRLVDGSESPACPVADGHDDAPVGTTL